VTSWQWCNEELVCSLQLNAAGRGIARAGGSPPCVRELVARGHAVHVEQGVGEDIAMPDAAYAAGGARIAPSTADVFAESELVVKVKELQPHKRGWLRRA